MTSKKSLNLQYENDKVNHIWKVSDQDFLLWVSNTKILYPPKERKNSGPSCGGIYEYAEISAERFLKFLIEKMRFRAILSKIFAHV